MSPPADRTVQPEGHTGQDEHQAVDRQVAADGIRLPGFTADRLSTRTLEDAVTEVLRAAILSRQLPPGAELRQAQLAELLGVSRIPLRDALHRLEAEGLVATNSRRAARVVSLSAEDAREIYDLRIMLEPEAAKRALARITPATARHLVHLSESMDRVADDPVEGSRARRRFYAELYRHSGSPRLATMVIRLRDEVSRYHVLATSESHAAHAALRRYILERDGTTAATLLRHHLERARDDLVASLTSAPEAPVEGASDEDQGEGTS